MKSGKGKRSYTGTFFMIGAMFLVLGFIASRGFLAIGFIFMIIALASIGRPPMRLLDRFEEGENDGEDVPK